MFVGSPILAQLVSDGLMDDIREVLEKCEPSWRVADSVDSEGQSLIHLAVAQGRPDLVQLLLEFEPDVEAQSRSGFTPLERSESSTWGPIHLTAGGGHVEKKEIWREKGNGEGIREREPSSFVQERRKRTRLIIRPFWTILARGCIPCKISGSD